MIIVITTFYYYYYHHYHYHRQSSLRGILNSKPNERDDTTLKVAFLFDNFLPFFFFFFFFFFLTISKTYKHSIWKRSVKKAQYKGTGKVFFFFFFLTIEPLICLNSMSKTCVELWKYLFLPFIRSPFSPVPFSLSLSLSFSITYNKSRLFFSKIPKLYTAISTKSQFGHTFSLYIINVLNSL
ncbi:hypothetical protein PUN28_004385 [Cardiocondyla obscurior]|uniref:Uncharacterized protein n=1 Tax=Cardiocondyla obscurior TaxID=286306 RepID=A0AAW2GCF6_9HYME